MPLGTAAMPLTPAAQDAPPACPAARGRRDHLLQDHDAGLRHDLVGRLELPSAHPQSVGSVEEPRRIELGRGRRGRCRLRPAACRHRHRRLGAAAGRMVRAGRPQAEPRAHPDRSALCGALRRPDDAHGRRRRADDGGAGKAGSSRRHEPAGAGHRLDEPVGRPEGQAHRAAAGRRRRHGGRAGGEGRGRGDGEMVRRSGRDRRAGCAADVAADHAGPRHVLPRALVGRHRADAGGDAREDPSLHAEMGRRRRERCPASMRSAASTRPWSCAASPRCCSARSTT